MGDDAGLSGVPTSLSSPSLCLNLDTLSSDGSVAGTGDVPSVELGQIDPIVISDQELSVISVHSDDPDLEAFDAQVQQSPSHYSTPTVPADLSVASPVLISPNRV